MADKDFNLPVPHVYDDGSVNTVDVYTYSDDGDINDFFVIGDGRDSTILVNSPQHADALARAITIAAKKKWG